MKGSECKFVKYMEGSDKRFVIPVYQRNYDWKTENCKQLYDDLVKIIKGHRKSHFFGSLVSVYNPDGHNEEFLIIDGQQRLMHFVLGPSHDETGIVIRLLQTERSISFDHFGNILDFHDPTTLFEKAIIFSMYHIRRPLVRGLWSRL